MKYIKRILRSNEKINRKNWDEKENRKSNNEIKKTHIRIYTHTHAHARTHTHGHAHTHIHTHTQH